MLRELLRRVDMMVILENKLDVFVRLHSALEIMQEFGFTAEEIETAVEQKAVFKFV
jgi:hypothetical protein